jgi:hypothetical protein
MPLRQEKVVNVLEVNAELNRLFNNSDPLFSNNGNHLFLNTLGMVAVVDV